MVRWPAIRGNVPVDPSSAFEHRTGKYGRRARHTYRMAASCRALGRRDESLMALAALGEDAGHVAASTVQHGQLISSSTTHGRAIAAGSRTNRVANRESGVSSGFTSMSAPA
jgi:hypothetical protein